MISRRASRITSRSKQKEYYSDFTMNFDLNPVTGSLERLVNHDSVKQSMKNIIMTQQGERPYSDFGSLVPHSLFDGNDPVQLENLKINIEHAISRFEPRAINVQILVYMSQDLNTYNVDISFAERNFPTIPQTVSIIRRIR